MAELAEIAEATMIDRAVRPNGMSSRKSTMQPRRPTTADPYSGLTTTTRSDSSGVAIGELARDVSDEVPHIPRAASIRELARGAWEAEERTPLEGATATIFSISASEGPNTILRNAIGKAVASLELAKEIRAKRDVWHIVDGFADEGHRIGAYYLFRAICLVFYEALHPTIAIQVGSSWLESMNDHRHASNIDKFDKEKDTDLFELLSPQQRQRPEIAYIYFFHKLFRPLNGFTVAVDPLFDAALQMPFCSTSQYQLALSFVERQRGAEADGSDEDLLQPMMKAASLTSDAHGRVLLHACLLAAATAEATAEDSMSSAALDTTGGEAGGSSADVPSTEGVADGGAANASVEPTAFSLESLMLESGLGGVTSFDAVGVEDGADSPDGVEALSGASFFSAEFVRAFGSLLSADVAKSAGRYETKGPLKVPLDTAAFLATLSKLQGAEPLSCDAFRALAHTLEPHELANLQLSTKKRWLAYDHVRVTTDNPGSVTAIYVARGRPDQWMPETKKDHRRGLVPGVWACRTPHNDSDAEFWRARRAIALVHGVAPPRGGGRGGGRDARHKKNDDDERGAYRVDIDGGDESAPFDERDGCVVAHFFADMIPQYADVGGADAPVAEGVGRKPLHSLRVLNTHLGKAGGLNFGLEAILRSSIVPLPTATHPHFFGIIDARHSCDKRFWRHVLPEFFEVHEIDDQVVFNPNVILCQVPHSYIGMKQATDKLDVRNNFFFGGMAIFRNRANGMTSAVSDTWRLQMEHPLARPLLPLTPHPLESLESRVRAPVASGRLHRTRTRASSSSAAR